MNRSTSISTSYRSPSNSLPLRAAISRLLQKILEQLAEYAGNKKVAQIIDRDINAYLVYMRTVYVPRQFGGDTRAISPKS